MTQGFHESDRNQPPSNDPKKATRGADDADRDHSIDAKTLAPDKIAAAESGSLDSYEGGGQMGDDDASNRVQHSEQPSNEQGKRGPRNAASNPNFGPAGGTGEGHMAGQAGAKEKKDEEDAA